MNIYLKIFIVLFGIYLGISLLHELFYSGSHKTLSFSSCCSRCPPVPLLMNSWNRFNPVLGGVDVVSYFDLKEEHGETEPVMGTTTYSITYLGYKFYFHNQTNLNKFQRAPHAFIPQWGGYCAKGIALEYCASDPDFTHLKKQNPYISGDFPWSADCLGPTASRDCWVILNNKLFLFYSQEAKDIFLLNPVTNYGLGETRWKQFLNQWSREAANKIRISTSSFPSWKQIEMHRSYV